MKTRKITLVATLLMLLMSMFFLSGCNTWKGLGKDVEKTGEGMQ